MGSSALRALFEWINTLREEKISSAEDIASGVVVWGVLRDIDPEAFASDLPVAGTTWEEKLKNLQHVEECLTQYVIKRCKKQLPLPSGAPDLEALAKNSTRKDACQLLKLVLLAAVFGRFSMDYIAQLSYLSDDAQAQFYLILEEPAAVKSRKSSPKSTTPEPTPEAKPEEVQQDPEIIYEERISKLVSQNKQLNQDALELRDQLDSLHDLHTKLQNSYDNLETKHKDTADRLETLRSGKGEQSLLGIQRTKMQQQETVIAEFEGRLGSISQERDSLQAEVQVLGDQLDDYQQAKDDVYELRLANDKLQRSANAAEKYKQKLQGFQRIESENESLKYRVTELQRELKQSDSDHLSRSDLQKENDEYRTLVSGIERELGDSLEAKKRAEHDKTVMELKLNKVEEQGSMWQRRFHDLSRDMTDHPDADPHTIRAPSKGFESDGEDEDGDEAKAETTDGDAMASLRAHFATRRSTGGAGTEKLLQKLDLVDSQARQLQKEVQEKDETIAALRRERGNAVVTTRPSEESPIGKPLPPVPSEPEPSTFMMIKTERDNLQREVALMASAWYDQNTRLIGNPSQFGRGRAGQESWSFLGRQRRTVANLVMGRDG